jgi:hypothetical protein
MVINNHHHTAEENKRNAFSPPLHHVVHPVRVLALPFFLSLHTRDGKERNTTVVNFRNTLVDAARARLLLFPLHSFWQRFFSTKATQMFVAALEGNRRRLTAEAVQGAALALIDDVHGGDGLPAGVLGVPVGDAINLSSDSKKFCQKTFVSIFFHPQKIQRQEGTTFSPSQHLPSSPSRVYIK